MRKFEIEHLTSRIEQTVKCTNGSISTILNKQKKGTGLTDTKKLEMIRSGKAVLKPFEFLTENQTSYREPIKVDLLRCFEFPATDTQKEKTAYNERIASKIEELHNEVGLEGRRLLDRAVLGIVAAKDIPDELYKLGEMVNLAR